MKKLKAWDIFTLVAGSMIGSGIFLVSSGILRDTGHPFWLLLVWLLAGLLTIAGALSYAELAAMFPENGGQMIFIQRAWGPAWAFAYGICVVFVIQTGVIAAVATAFSLYLSEIPILLGLRSGELSVWSIRLMAVGMIALLTYIQCKGQKQGVRIQHFFTVIKVMALGFVILLGLIAFIKDPAILRKNFSDSFDFFHYDPEKNTFHTLSFFPWLSFFFSAFIGALFSMDAWNNATFVAARTEDPEKNMPRGLISGVLTVTILYLLANLAYLSMLPSGIDSGKENIRSIAFCDSGRVATASLSVFFDNKAALIVALLIVISTFGCNNGIVFSGGVFIQSMAQKQWLPGILSMENKNASPRNALLFQALWSSVLVFTGSYSDLLVYATFASLVFYMITIAGLFSIRKKYAGRPRPYSCPGYPWIPVFYLIITAAVCISLMITQTFNCVMGLLFPMMAGIIHLFFLSKRLPNERTV